jgi:hypothetical protein
MPAFRNGQDIAGGTEACIDAAVKPPSAFTPRFAHFRAVFDNAREMRNGRGRNSKQRETPK